MSRRDAPQELKSGDAQQADIWPPWCLVPWGSSLMVSRTRLRFYFLLSPKATPGPKVLPLVVQGPFIFTSAVSEAG